MAIIRIIDKEMVDERQGEGSNILPVGTIDPLKWMIGSYYKKDQDSITNLSADGFHRAWVWGVDYENPSFVNGIFEGKKQRIAMTYNGTGLIKDYTAKQLEEYLLSKLNFNKSFSGHNIEIPIASLDTDPEVFSDSAIDVESFYNYEFFNYENLSTVLNSNVLPSYLLFNYAQFAQDFNSEKANFIRSYDGNISYSNEKVAVDIYDNEDSNLYTYNRSIRMESMPASDDYRWEIKSQKNNYFKLFTDLLIDPQANTNLSAFETKNSNVFVHYQNDSDRLDYLPYWNRINIPKMSDLYAPAGPSTVTVLKQDTTLIDEALINNRLVKFLFIFMKNVKPVYRDFYYTKITPQNASATNLLDYYSPGTSTTTQLKKLKVWDLMEWWRTENFDLLPEQSDETFLLSEEDLDLLGPHAMSEIRVRKVIALGMIRSTIRQSLQDFSDSIIKNNEKAKSIIGFKVEKFLSSSSNESRTPIQTFYFEQRNEAIDFVDTQVSFDTKYYYSISALTVVVGSSYYYDNLKVRERASGDLLAQFDFTTSPSLKIIEIPLEEFETRIIEPPPLRPMVHVSNEKFVKNKVKFFVQDSLGNVVDDYGVEKYITILNDDLTYYDKLIDSYKRKDERFFYSSRASTGIFEVFRIETKPTSYSDFESGRLGLVQSQTNTSIDAFNSSEFIDFIEHEKTYYYLFRALTPWGRASNPSYVFEVYLIQDADEVKMILDAYPIEEPSVKTDQHVTMRRFLQLIPNPQHLEVNPTNNADENGNFLVDPQKLKLGTPGIDSDLWQFSDYSKKFIKLRLTSKTSGKKMDLNLIFKVKPETEQN